MLSRKFSCKLLKKVIRHFSIVFIRCLPYSCVCNNLVCHLNPSSQLFVLAKTYINPILGDLISVLKMLRPVHLILLVSMMVLVSCLEKPLKPATVEVESSLNNVKDLNADATAYDSDRQHYGHGWNGGGGGHGGGGGGHGGGGNGHGGGWGGHGGGWEGRGG